MKRIFIVPASAVLLFLACKQPEATVSAPMATLNLDSVKQEISAVNAKFGEAFVKGDSATMVSLYTSDAEIYGPNMPKMSAATMGIGIKGMPAMGIKKMVLTTSEVSGGPDIVNETGTYAISDSSKVIEKGKYIVLWKKEGGSWKLFRDIWNSDDPPMAMPATKK